MPALITDPNRRKCGSCKAKRYLHQFPHPEAKACSQCVERRKAAYRDKKKDRRIAQNIADPAYDPTADTQPWEAFTADLCDPCAHKPGDHCRLQLDPAKQWGPETACPYWRVPLHNDARATTCNAPAPGKPLRPAAGGNA